MNLIFVYKKMSNKKRIDKKSPSFIDSTRMDQLKAFTSYAKNNDKNYEKKFSSLEVIQNSLIDMNKDKVKPLRRFLSMYIPNLNKKEIDELYVKIFKYKKFIENTFYYEQNKNSFPQEVFDVLTFPEQFSLKEVLYYLLMNFVFLPYYENQQDFNNQMIWILNRLDNFISKLYPENIFIVPINPGYVWDALELDWFATPIAIKESIYSHPFLRKIWLLVDLPSNDEYAYEAIDKDKVEMSLVLELWKKFKNNWLRLTYTFVVDLFSKIKWLTRVGNDYLRVLDRKDNHVKTFVKLEKPQIEVDSEWNQKHYLQIRIYTEPNEKILQTGTYDYLAYSLKLLTEYVEEIIDLLNEQFLDKKDIKKLDKIIVDFNTAVENYEANNFDDEDSEFSSDDRISSSKSKILHKVDLQKIKVEEKLILPENLEEQLNYLLDYLKRREVYLEYRNKPRKWAVFYWPPGVGKTEFVKFLAKNTWCDFFYINTDDIRNMYVWESEKKIRGAFTEFYDSLKSWNWILYIDEIDGLMWAKWEKDHMEWVRSIFLQELDGFATDNELWKKWFIIVSTNYPQAIDKALKQRLWFKVKFQMPTEKEVIKFFEYYFNKLKGKWVKIDISSDQISNIVWIKSYRVLREILDHAVRSSIQQGNIPPVINEEFIRKWLQIALEQEEDEKKVGFLN